ncbi:hypothetical protein B0J14DRAFT_183892 [Halenospora varia]|nr:hypothetical protein B0J14DRAFT_183892 [Halenospora varia]
MRGYKLSGEARRGAGLSRQNRRDGDIHKRKSRCGSGVFSSIFTSRKDDNSIEKHLLADQFAEEIPEYKFTPAEVQGYLLQYKDRPMTAVQRAKEWVRETLLRKEGSKKWGESKEEKSDDRGVKEQLKRE